MRCAVHWEELLPYVKANPDTLFVLIHFSLRYKDTEILEFFQKQVMEHGIRNIKPWLTDISDELVFPDQKVAAAAAAAATAEPTDKEVTETAAAAVTESS